MTALRLGEVLSQWSLWDIWWLGRGLIWRSRHLLLWPLPSRAPRSAIARYQLALLASLSAALGSLWSYSSAATHSAPRPSPPRTSAKEVLVCLDSLAKEPVANGASLDLLARCFAICRMLEEDWESLRRPCPNLGMLSPLLLLAGPRLGLLVRRLWKGGLGWALLEQNRSRLPMSAWHAAGGAVGCGCVGGDAGCRAWRLPRTMAGSWIASPRRIEQSQNKRRRLLPSRSQGRIKCERPSRARMLLWRWRHLTYVSV